MSDSAVSTTVASVHRSPGGVVQKNRRERRTGNVPGTLFPPIGRKLVRWLRSRQDRTGPTAPEFGDIAFTKRIHQFEMKIVKPRCDLRTNPLIVHLP